jgi:hypothetical protein
MVASEGFKKHRAKEEYKKNPGGSIYGKSYKLKE